MSSQLRSVRNSKMTLESIFIHDLQSGTSDIINYFVWNALGFGNLRAFRELRRLIAKSNPAMLFICETKLYHSQYASWRNCFQYNEIFTVDCEGRKCGLALLWKYSFEIHICSHSSDILIVLCLMSKKLGGSRFYGSHISSFRHFLEASLLDCIIYMSLNICHG